MKVVVTGGYGFIASELTERLVGLGNEVLVIDSMTYAADPRNLDAIAGKFEHFMCPVQNKEAGDVLRDFRPDVIYHAAAESHVDRSIASYREFIETNVNGTWNLLEACRDITPAPLFVYVSTDEVYGSLQVGRAHEGTGLNPSNPYAVTKSAAEHAVRSAFNTWRIPFVITRSCNNYGPRQYPEKLIPRAVTSLLTSESIPIHGDGRNVREWIHVSDNVRGLMTVADKGSIGETYNITTGYGLSNRQVVTQISEILSKPLLIDYKPDRPGNDYRYAMDASKIQELGWHPEIPFADGLKQTVAWYSASRKWWHAKG